MVIKEAPVSAVGCGLVHSIEGLCKLSQGGKDVDCIRFVKTVMGVTTSDYHTSTKLGEILCFGCGQGYYNYR